uniref:Secreted protein n=1 Tax=Gouania willdenowi TaxID=441366 RepID=A0A8C5FXV3_GOUWI
MLGWLSAKIAFLLAITTAKCVGELHALSLDPSCPGHSGVTLSSCDQPILLARFNPPGEDSCRSALLCPVLALGAYVEGLPIKVDPTSYSICVSWRKKLNIDILCVKHKMF